MYELGSDKKVLSKSIAVSIQICIYLILYVLTYTKKDFLQGKNQSKLS